MPVGGEALVHTADAVFLIEEMSLGSKEIADFWGGKYRDTIDVVRAVKSVTTPIFPHPVRLGRDAKTGVMAVHAGPARELRAARRSRAEPCSPARVVSDDAVLDVAAGRRRAGGRAPRARPLARPRGGPRRARRARSGVPPHLAFALEGLVEREGEAALSPDGPRLASRS